MKSNDFIPQVPSYMGELEELTDENRTKVNLIGVINTYKRVSPSEFDILYDNTESELTTKLAALRTEYYRTTQRGA